MTLPTVPFDTKYSRPVPTSFPYFRPSSGVLSVSDVGPTEYPLDTSQYIGRAAWIIDAQFVEPPVPGNHPTYRGDYPVRPLIKVAYYPLTYVSFREDEDDARSDLIYRVFWIGSDVLGINIQNAEALPLVRPYELADHEIESAHNEYLLQHGLSRSAHLALIDAQNVTEVALYSRTGDATDDDVEMLDILKRYSKIAYHTHQAYEATHFIKQMTPRPETEEQALAIFAERAPLPSDFAAEVAELDRLTSASQMRRHWNLVYPAANDRIKSNVADLETLLVADTATIDNPVSLDLTAETLALEVPATAFSFGVAGTAKEDGTLRGLGIFQFRDADGNAVDSREVELTVTSEDGLHTNSFTLTVSKAAAEGDA